jgi:hypothetical protein
MAKLNYNPELEIGDRVICIKMDDEYSPIPMGIGGVVVSKSNVFGEVQYNVKWDNGSSLSLISSIDRWVKEDEMKNRRKKTEESFIINTTKKDFLKENFFQQNKELFKNFNHLLLHKYLNALRRSGVTNMLGASPYLYMGKERIKHTHHYDEMSDEREESFKEVLELADKVRNEMISGAMKVLESKDKEITPNSVERVIKEYSGKMLMAYTQFAGGHLNIK